MYKIILSSKSDAVNYNNSKFSTSHEIIPINFDSYYQLEKNKKFNHLNIRNLSNSYNDIKKRVSDIKLFSENLEKILSTSNIDISIKESLKTLAPKTFSSLLYLGSVIENNQSYMILLNNCWTKISKKSLVIQEILKKNNDGTFNSSALINNSYNSNKNFYFDFIATFINSVIFFLCRKKNIFWTTGTNSKLNEFVHRSLRLNKNYIAFKFAQYDKFYFPRALYSLYLLLNPFIKNKYISLVPVLSFKDNKKNFLNLSKIIELSLSKNLKEYNSLIVNNIYRCLEYTQCLKNYSLENILIKNTKFIIAHHIRNLDGVALSVAGKFFDKKIYLISHSSHSITNDDIGNYMQMNNSYGLIKSDLSTKIVVQSKVGYNFIKHIYSKKDLIFTKPIMWSRYDLNKSNNIKSSRFKILFADTIKSLSRVPYIYDTGFEYINNLKKIINSIDNFQDIDFIIRFRENSDISLSTMKQLFIDYNNIQIKSNGSFLDDISNSNLLISHSSTTIEESLYDRVPVALYGGENNYFHLKGSKFPPNKDSRYAVYCLNNENINKMISNIVKYHSNTLLTDLELSNYIWLENDKNVKSVNEFIESIL